MALRLCVPLVLASLLSSQHAQAHPYGISSISRLIAIEPRRNELVFAYVLDFAELPAENELRSLDADHDGAVTQSEQAIYLQGVVDPNVATWTVTADGQRLNLRVLHRSVEVADGEARLHTLRVLAEIHADLPQDVQHARDWTLSIQDDSRNERPGWRELRVDDGPTMMAQLVSVSPGRDGGGGTRALLRMDQAVFRVRSVGHPTNRTVAQAAARGGRPVSTGWLLLALLILLMIVTVFRATSARRMK